MKNCITPQQFDVNANVGKPKDIIRVLEYFRYKVGTTLDAMIDTGILRNSITWHVDALQKMNLLFVAYRKPDRNTGFMANHYTADQSKQQKVDDRQLSLFDIDSITRKNGGCNETVI